MYFGKFINWGVGKDNQITLRKCTWPSENSRRLIPLCMQVASILLQQLGAMRLRFWICTVPTAFKIAKISAWSTPQSLSNLNRISNLVFLQKAPTPVFQYPVYFYNISEQYTLDSVSVGSIQQKSLHEVRHNHYLT